MSPSYLNESKYILNNLHKIVNLKGDAAYTTEQKRKEDLKKSYLDIHSSKIVYPITGENNSVLHIQEREMV